MPPGVSLNSWQAETIKRSRTGPRKGPTIGWELVVVLLNIAGPLNCHCVCTICCIFTKKNRTSYITHSNMLKFCMDVGQTFINMLELFQIFVR